jgi:hypothetical protein
MITAEYEMKLTLKQNRIPDRFETTLPKEIVQSVFKAVRSRRCASSAQ